MLLLSNQDGNKQLSSDDGPSDFSLFRLSTIEDQTSRRKVPTMKEGTGECMWDVSVLFIVKLILWFQHILLCFRGNARDCA